MVGHLSVYWTSNKTIFSSVKNEMKGIENHGYGIVKI